MKEKIKRLAQQYHSRVVKIRQHLHAHPELSFEEYDTSKYIAGILDEIGVAYTDGWAGGTGIVAELGKGNYVYALRADIDALPICEESDESYCSTHDGVMHACGHDAHTASLLGAIMILREIEDELKARYRFIFQPGEEKLPGGASLMIENGVLADPKVSGIVGQHVHPALAVGQIGVHSGYFMASCDELYITVRGKGGHAAMPQDTIDPIYISAELITVLQSVCSRSAHPGVPSVLSIGKINSTGGATNIIPDEVKMAGTLRTFSEEWRQQAYQRMRDIAAGIGQAHGAHIEVEIIEGYPALYNDPKLSAHLKSAMAEYLGAENIIDLPQRMTAEDFAYYSHEVPAQFYRLGTASRDGSKSSPVHTPTFDIDHEALLHGTGLMAWLAVMMSRQE